MKIRLHREQCISSGNCVQAAPRLFAQDDEGLVVALVERPGASDLDDLHKAIASCPTAVITIEKEGENGA
jgi:ferredoxin